MSDPAVTALTDDEKAVEKLAECVSAGKCILFLGAGVHYPPPEGAGYTYPENERPPLGAALSQELAKECEFHRKFPRDSDRDLKRVALCYELSNGRNQLVSEIRKRVDQGKQPSPVLRALARLNFPLVITTNYDLLFERALQGATKYPRSIIYTPNENSQTPDHEPEPNAPVILKIHGSVAEPESIVITDEDYIQFVLRMSEKEPFNPVPVTFLYHLKRWPTLFVGYSLMDYNLRLLFKTLRWRIDPAKRPDTYSVDRYPDPLILEVWWNKSRLVRFIAQDVWKFVPDLYRRVTGEEMPA